jgi:hypothetical protein
MLLYNTEWLYDHGMAVNYHGKKFYKHSAQVAGCAVNLINVLNHNENANNYTTNKESK